MKTQSQDTKSQIEQIQISLIKKQSLSRKFAQVCSLSQTTLHLSKRAISRVNSKLDEQKINLLFISYQYGKDLADRVEKYINRS